MKLLRWRPSFLDCFALGTVAEWRVRGSSDTGAHRSVS